VIGVIFGGPSEKAGIQPGDRIIEVENKTVAGTGISNDEIISMLRGTRGTEVNIKVLRRRAPDLLSYTIKRNKIPIYSVDAYYLVNSDIGYIKMNRFSATTYKEFMEATSKLNEQGMKSLILDLRGNGGGYLNEATAIVDEFLETNKLIVYTEGKNRKKQSYKSSNKSSLVQTRLAILIDENSASASEIVAGAIQDHDRGIIVGRRSFGKGLVQEQLQLSDGSALRLTVARYYTPSGRCIQKPYSDDIEAYYTKNSLELFLHPDSLRKIADTLGFEEELEKYYTTSGKVVYGGGGIIPDFFIPYDTTSFTPYLRKVNNTGIIYDFAFDFADKNRDIFSKIKSYRDYDQEKALKDRAFREFIAYAEKQGIRRNDAEIKKSETFIRQRLKAFIARNVWGNEAYYFYLNSKDSIFEKAVLELSTIN
jgi:carboxyl-terminal processing protease